MQFLRCSFKMRHWPTDSYKGSATCKRCELFLFLTVPDEEIIPWNILGFIWRGLIHLSPALVEILFPLCYSSLGCSAILGKPFLLLFCVERMPLLSVLAMGWWRWESCAGSAAGSTICHISTPSHLPLEPLLPRMDLKLNGRGSLHCTIWHLQYLLSSVAMTLLLLKWYLWRQISYKNNERLLFSFRFILPREDVYRFNWLINQIKLIHWLNFYLTR